MNKSALILSAFLTTVVLTILGGVFYNARSTEPKAVEQATEIAPEIQQAILEREAAYQQVIEQANLRLAQAEQEAQAVEIANQASVAEVNALPLVTPEQAAEIASNYLGQSSIYSVEIVSMDGTDVYKVTFSSGDVVYVSQAGEVISVQIISLRPEPVAEKYNENHSSRSGSGGGGGELEEEHEGGDD